MHTRYYCRITYSWGHTEDRRTGSQSATLRQNSTPKRTLKDISLEPAVSILYYRVQQVAILVVLASSTNNDVEE